MCRTVYIWRLGRIQRGGRPLTANCSGITWNRDWSMQSVARRTGISRWEMNASENKSQACSGGVLSRDVPGGQKGRKNWRRVTFYKGEIVVCPRFFWNAVDVLLAAPMGAATLCSQIPSLCTNLQGAWRIAKQPTQSTAPISGVGIDNRQEKSGESLSPGSSSSTGEAIP